MNHTTHPMSAPELVALVDDLMREKEASAREETAATLLRLIKMAATPAPAPAPAPTLESMTFTSVLNVYTLAPTARVLDLNAHLDNRLAQLSAILQVTVGGGFEEHGRDVQDSFLLLASSLADECHELHEAAQFLTCQTDAARAHGEAA
jgi:hypothetical protein